MINKIKAPLCVILMLLNSSCATENSENETTKSDVAVIEQLTASQNTIRNFSDKEVKEEDLEKILSVAFNGATSGGQQGRELIVINDREIMMEIKNAHPYAMSLNTAPILVVIAGNENKAMYPENLVQDTSIAMQNIVLMASAHNMDSNIMSIYPQKDRITGVQKALELPEHIIPYIMVSIGYSVETDTVTSSTSKSKNINNMIHYNVWNE